MSRTQLIVAMSRIKRKAALKNFTVIGTLIVR